MESAVGERAALRIDQRARECGCARQAEVGVLRIVGPDVQRAGPVLEDTLEELNRIAQRGFFKVQHEESSAECNAYVLPSVLGEKVTLDILYTVDSAGVQAIAGTIYFDYDLGNELDLIAATEFDSKATFGIEFWVTAFA